MLFIQLVDKQKRKSPAVLAFGSDEEEALDFIQKWRADLLKWAKRMMEAGLYID